MYVHSVKTFECRLSTRFAEGEYRECFERNNLLSSGMWADLVPHYSQFASSINHRDLLCTHTIVINNVVKCDKKGHVAGNSQIAWDNNQAST